MGISDNDGRVLLGKTLALFQVEDGQRYGLLLRDNRVLCAVPEERATAEKAFSLYQPQRRKARALASTFRLAMRAGVHLRVLKPWIVKDNGTLGLKSVDWVDPSSSPGVLVGSTGHLCERAVVVLRVAGEWGRYARWPSALREGESYARLASLGKRFEYLPRVLADFRLHEESISRGNLNCHDIDGILRLQRQVAEPRAIRRLYGIKLFRDEASNSIIDSLLHHIFRFKKGVMKMLYRGRCGIPDSH